MFKYNGIYALYFLNQLRFLNRANKPIINFTVLRSMPIITFPTAAIYSINPSAEPTMQKKRTCPRQKTAEYRKTAVPEIAINSTSSANTALFFAAGGKTILSVLKISKKTPIPIPSKQDSRNSEHCSETVKNVSRDIKCTLPE